MIQKSKRHFLIKEIITHDIIGNQDDLAKELHHRGLDVTQATLSRDLQELNVARVAGVSGSRYVLQTEPKEKQIESLVGYEMTQIDINETMVVIRTLPGRASGVASYLDSLHHPLILGTIAGDDTLVLIPQSIKKTKLIYKFIQSLMTETSE